MSAAEVFFGWQKRNCGCALRQLFLNGVGRSKFKTILPVSMHTRPGQTIVMRDQRRRFAGGQPTVDLRAFQVLACLTCAHAFDGSRVA
jgi:hypothetical protein